MERNVQAKRRRNRGVGVEPQRYWLMKSEPSVFSIKDLRSSLGQVTGWDGVRNYQARNFMREMRVGDGVLFYHSNAEPSGIAGLSEVARTASPDLTQFDPKDIHFDPKAKREAPIWLQVDVRYVEAFPRVLSLEELRGIPALSGMVLFKSGRLSVQPVARVEWQVILKMVSQSFALNPIFSCCPGLSRA
jgi:predicted RNA-binding protein with PUA-like domain